MVDPPSTRHRHEGGHEEQVAQGEFLHPPILQGSTRAEAVPSLALQAGIFFNFKLVAGSSPLQYLKQIRQGRAKRLMIHDGYNASTAAKAVGYESASQFSREFKRQFGMTPTEDVERQRQVVEAKPVRR